MIPIMAATISTGFIMFDVLLICGTIFLAVYVYFKHSYQYWKKKGVPYLKPVFPYGNNTCLLQKALTFTREANMWYDELKAGGHKFGGVWSLSRKALLLIHPDYIRDVLSQDFQYFMDRDFYENEKKDPMGTHLFNITSPSWKPLRHKLTPTFTSGKMKMMFQTVLKCSDAMINYLEKCSKIGDDIEIREVLASFTTDVIGSVAFGLDCNSFDNSHAEFRKQGKELFRTNLRLYIRVLMARSFPDLARKIGIKSFKEGTTDFFKNMVKQTIDYRKKNNVNRPDFLQILINMNNESTEGQKRFPFEQIVANTMIFFIAGFDTSSTVMTFTLLNLAEYPDIQEKTRSEIKKVLQKYGGEITYESLQEMAYLQQVLDETMRMYPPVTTLARICTKNYTLRNTDIVIEKGTPVVVSTLGLGRDPEYFPDPDRFDPDRFSHDQKAKRHPYIHIPFGEGPRNCIGLRFGLMQSKIGLIRVLTNFKLSISPKTKLPVKLDPAVLLLKEMDTLYLRAEKI